MNKFFSLHLTHLPTWRHRVVLVVALLAVVLGVGALSFAPAAHAASRAQTSSANRSAVAMSAAGTYEGCPSGYACIYPENTGWNGGHPESNGYYLSYGVHELYGQYGNHYVFNNQTGGALVYLCINTNGTDCIVIYADQAFNVNLTPINSIVLDPPIVIV